jgi:hypothetical protein
MFSYNSQIYVVEAAMFYFSVYLFNVLMKKYNCDRTKSNKIKKKIKITGLQFYEFYTIDDFYFTQQFSTY